MDSRFNRRDFLAASVAAGAGLALASRLDAAPWKTTLHKALIYSEADGDFQKTVKRWKAAGFEGLQTCLWQATPQQIAAARAFAESQGMKIHSVLFGWGEFNRGDAALAKTVADMKTTLQAAQAYGARDVLFVPCRIDGMAMPEPWQFDIRFDEKTGHLRQVVAGDNDRYQKYIEAHNHAVDTTREGVNQLIPTAEKTGVIIALENVWNNLWVKPDLFQNFVASFRSPSVMAFFDIGNHVKYAPSQDWIYTLGKLITSCHVKDYKLPPNGRGGDLSSFCNIRDGSVNWPAVRKALDDVGYNGWMTIEGGTLSPEEHSKRLDLIFAGQ
jgi:L-ribulose-5-phosphate 3-epimerase